MPRIAENTDALLKDLTGRLERLVAAARKEGRNDALAGLRKLVGGTAPTGGIEGVNGARKRRGGTAKAAPAARKRGGARKNPWASLSPEARLARINAIRKGRGLPAKSSL